MNVKLTYMESWTWTKADSIVLTSGWVNYNIYLTIYVPEKSVLTGK